MDEKTSDRSSVLMDVNPAARETELLVNKNIRTLEDLRKSFTPGQSSVLSEVRSFLPKLATANEDLQKRLQADPSYSADIENIEDSESPHIEMNLALVEAEYSSEDSSLDSDTSSDDENADNSGLIAEVNEENIKLPKQGLKNTHGKQLIQTINEEEKSNADISGENRQGDGT